MSYGVKPRYIAGSSPEYVLYERTKEETREIEERNFQRHLADMEPMAKLAYWLFRPGFLRRAKALLKGKLIWTAY